MATTSTRSARPVDVLDRTLGLASSVLVASHARRARAAGLDRLVAVVSFDCDTDLDLDVVGEVHERMGQIGIVPAYAVPGELLQRGHAVYAGIAASGAEFLNHGHRQHCTFDPVSRTYESSFFYDELPQSTVVADIRAGHDAVVSVTGVVPTGFRAPHFGTFQRRAQRRRLHATLHEMGYEYSSSTMPMFGTLRGPIVREDGVVELPVSGCPDKPRRVLDSWSFRFAPRPTGTEADYVEQVTKLVALHEGRPGVINLYADPSQVIGWDGFFRAMEVVAPHALESMAAVMKLVGA